jgi:hypothetical protein
MEAPIMKQKMLSLVGIFLVIGLLSACNQDDQVVEQMMDKLEKTAEVEADFAAQQDPLVELETKEQALYEQMKELGLGEIDEIIKLANEASTYADERKTLIANEKQAIDASNAEFEEVYELAKQIEDETLKEKANTVVAEWDKRYNSYSDLNEKYNETIELDQEFYQLFQLEDIEMEEIQQIIESINKKYEEILNLKEEFNTHTTAYNDAKIEFYKAANIEVIIADEQE